MKVYFIGAGPGDLELLTVKAKRVIEKADIIIYAGSLVNRDILKLARPGAKIYDSSDMTLAEILGIIQAARGRDKIIARIHSGDPSIYGAIQEQMDWCEKEALSYEVIPGISSFQAAAARLKQELTLPGVSQTVILTRISGRTSVPLPENLKNLARIKATLVIFLSIQAIERVVEELKKGYSLDTPVVVLEKISQKGERIIRGALRDIASQVKKARVKRQALIMVGRVFKKEYQPSRLYDKNFSHGFRSGMKKPTGKYFTCSSNLK